MLLVTVRCSFWELSRGLLSSQAVRLIECCLCCRFIREFTKGVEDSWTINKLNHFLPFVPPQEWIRFLSRVHLYFPPVMRALPGLYRIFSSVNWGKVVAVFCSLFCSLRNIRCVYLHGQVLVCGSFTHSIKMFLLNVISHQVWLVDKIGSNPKDTNILNLYMWQKRNKRNITSQTHISEWLLCWEVHIHMS